jgi:hypothetical protein
MRDSELAIVLTATIVPNAAFTAYADPEVRRREYLEAIRFYRQFAPVYFIENSAYRLSDDAEFREAGGLMIRKQPVSTARERGKGYQEFEMLDSWLASEVAPPRRWIKITGRYLYLNFGALLADCHRSAARMIIDQCPRSSKARGYLFCVETEFYSERLAGIYRECDDEAGEWIEHALYRRLSGLPTSEVRLFSEEPRLQAISGSTGESISATPLKFAAKRLLRRVNRVFDKQFLWYTR